MKLRTIVLILLASAGVYIAGNVFCSSNILTVDTYEIKSGKVKAPFRAVALSDLHNKEFGRNNRDLIEKVSSLDPDIILTLGDFVTKIDKRRSTAISLMSELTSIAPVYSCLGNHEREYEDYDGLIKDIRSTGARLLDNESVRVDINGSDVIIGGLTDYPYYEYNAPYYDVPEAHFLDKFIKEQEECFSVLMTHAPETFMWGLKDKELDLMLCGHTHGGIIRLPFIGGLIAPNQGILRGNGDILPEYTKGFYNSDTANMIVTSGLGNEAPVPRFNNPPEICVIDVK